MIYGHVTGVITDVVQHDEKNVRVEMLSDEDTVWCMTGIDTVEQFVIGSYVDVAGEMSMLDVSENDDVELSWSGRILSVKLREITRLASPYDNITVH